MNLWDALTRDRYNSGSLHCWRETTFETARWSEVVADARRMAYGLRRLGVGRGSCVATVLSNSRDAVRGVLGVWLAGGTLASLPVPARGMDLAEYRDELRTLAGQVEPCLLAVDDELRDLVPTPPAQARLATWQSLAGATELDPSPPELDELAFVQYSSGSTGTPKGCMLTARAIGAQLEIIRAAMGGEPGRETVCSWLPLSHDMGLFGCLLYAWAWDCDLILSTPQRFMVSPRTWFADMAECGCTQTAGTSSALNVATRAQRAARLARPLRLRSLVLGAERVEAQALDAALEAFGPSGLVPSALRPAYGLAEATLAVTATAIDQPPRARWLDSVALADGELHEAGANDRGATAIVSLGTPCPDVELRFAAAEEMSELHVRSTSMFSGYHGQPELTRERLRDGEFATRDLGFLHDGELYLVGRSDDVLAVDGRNVYTHEIEASVGALAGVRRGCCAIVDVPGTCTPHLTMLLEVRDGHTGFEEIAAAAARTATAKAGVNLSECVFLEKGALPKTPTGKVQRFRCRELLMTDGFAPLRRVASGASRGASTATGTPRVSSSRRRASDVETIVDVLVKRARETPEAPAVTFLRDGERDEQRWSYGVLERRARQIAARLQADGIAPGARALLLYPPGLEYAAAFLGCLQAGVIAVPAYPPLLNRPSSQLASFIANATPVLALTVEGIADLRGELVVQEPALGTLPWLATDRIEDGIEAAWRRPDIDAGTVAFLQYSSGSTSTPKGVVLSHANLLANTAALCDRVALGPQDVTVSWLPPYHDAGLIGKLLTPLFGGFPTVLMSPMAFLQRPARWLEAIERHRATCSAAPNFGYELCVRKTTAEQRAALDLSCWVRAMNTGEPVRAQTLRRFADAFAPAGFRIASFYPCYGLAESTVMVGGPDPAAAPQVMALDPAALQADRAILAKEPSRMHESVGCGRRLPGHRVIVVHPRTRQPLGEREVGEIWVHGPSVAQGYWQNPEATAKAFGAQPADGDRTPFLRTGDLGFLDAGEIHVTGRLKDMIVVRGRNHYPQDIERTAEQASSALRPGCGAAFGIERDGEERLVLVNEVDRGQLGDADDVLRSVRGAILRRHGIRPDAVVLIERGALPKTSSGKQRRRATREQLEAGELPIVTEWRVPRTRQAHGRAR